MDYVDKLKKIIKKNNGTILTSQLKQYGIPRVYLTKLFSEGKSERVQTGAFLNTLILLVGIILGVVIQILSNRKYTS